MFKAHARRDQNAASHSAPIVWKDEIKFYEAQWFGRHTDDDGATMDFVMAKPMSSVLSAEHRLPELDESGYRGALVVIPLDKIITIIGLMNNNKRTFIVDPSLPA